MKSSWHTEAMRNNSFRQACYGACRIYDYIALGHIHKPMNPQGRSDHLFRSAGACGQERYRSARLCKRRDHSIGSPDSVDSVCFKRIHSSRDPNKPRRYNRKYQREIEKQIQEYSNENIYKIILRGKRDHDVSLDTERMKAGRT